MIEIKVLPHDHVFASNTYLVSSGDESIVIDPSAPYDDSLMKNKVKYIILTHGHFDHMLDIDEWVEKTGAAVLVGEKDLCALADGELNCCNLFTSGNKGYFGKATSLSETDRLSLGGGVLRIISTPGHTPGSVSLLIENALFVGDTIFAGGGYGKCCFPGGDFSEIRKSILRLTMLDENTVVYPGHGPSTTIKEYKKDFLR